MNGILSGVAGLLMGLVAGNVAADDWRLAGTLLYGQSAAVIETKAGQQLLRSGEYHDSCELLRVSARAAWFRCDGIERMLALGGGPGELPQRSGSDPARATASVTLEHAFVRQVLGDRQRLVSTLSLEPVVEKGAIAGYRLLSASPGGLADRAGFQRGDIMRSVNGVTSDRGSAFMQMLNELEAARQVLIGFERDGQVLQKVVLLN